MLRLHTTVTPPQNKPWHWLGKRLRSKLLVEYLVRPIQFQVLRMLRRKREAQVPQRNSVLLLRQVVLESEYWIEKRRQATFNCLVPFLWFCASQNKSRRADIALCVEAIINVLLHLGQIGRQSRERARSKYSQHTSVPDQFSSL